MDERGVLKVWETFTCQAMDVWTSSCSCGCFVDKFSHAIRCQAHCRALNIGYARMNSFALAEICDGVLVWKVSNWMQSTHCKDEIIETLEAEEREPITSLDRDLKIGTSATTYHVDRELPEACS